MLVFTNRAGNVLESGNLRRRHLKPIVEGVNAPWAAFRHTFASLHLNQGTNLVHLSRALGHHSAAFTLSRYTHLMGQARRVKRRENAVDIKPKEQLHFVPMAQVDLFSGAGGLGS